MPEPELRNIIDKTAAYVLKNGKEFEEILRTKNDERFAFLKYTDQHYRYYVHKVTGAICSAPLPAKPIEEAVEKTNGVSNKTPKESAPSDVPSKVISKMNNIYLSISQYNIHSFCSFSQFLNQTQRRRSA